MPDPLTTTQQPVPEGGGLLRIRMRLAYDGGGFSGWASQPALRTVQGGLASAIEQVLRVPNVRIVVAGRTDAGVHALGQVCHVDMPAWSWPGSDRAVRRLNAVLPADIRIFEAQQAPSGFDARFSARFRRYEFLISDSGLMDPRARGAVLVHPGALDVTAMHDAGAALVGEHDFAAFCRARPEASSVRTVRSLSVQRRDDPRDPALIAVDICADAFCHSMVRSVVGALIAVGRGTLSADRLATMLRTGRREGAFSTVAAHGLALVEVGYPPDALLADQARRARRFRGGPRPAPS